VKIAVVGAGISGLVCTHLLDAAHEVTLFEAESRLGGHTYTVRARHEGRDIEVDTGFIVFNERNYPNFCKLIGDLGIEAQDAPMTFGVRDERSGIEYGGESLNALFAQRTNALRPSFWRMLQDIRRFHREAVASLAAEPADATLGDYIERHGYRREFAERFLIPMAGAIWSSPNGRMLEFPLHFLVRFFDHHGMLSLRDRPQWRTITGGSRRYVEAIAARAERTEIRLGTPIETIDRSSDGVTIRPRDGEPERFDAVILACHSDQALQLLAEPTPAEREVLGAIPYQANDTVLHTDESLMPRNRRAWSAWNGRITAEKQPHVVVTYDLTILQSLGTDTHLLVSLNQADDIDPERIFGRFCYEHPVFTLAGEAAKERHAEISGAGHHTHFCGAYWRNGFHEDGVRSALAVCEQFGAGL
jgi:predicted NAD/FAD-binding protein